MAQAAEVYPPMSTSADILAAGASKNRWTYPFDGQQMMAFNNLPLSPGTGSREQSQQGVSDKQAGQINTLLHIHSYAKDEMSNG